MHDQGWKTEDVEMVLQLRNYMYSLLHRTFCNAPDEQMLDALKSEATDQAVEFLLDGDEAACWAMDAIAGISGDSLEALKDEYTALLIGPAKLSAPPWESVYLNDGDLLFQESTLAVRRFYLKDGLVPAEYPHVADDHIALELDYVLTMGKRLCEDGLGGDEAASLVARQARFIEDHLMLWVPKYADRMRKSGRNILYPQMASLLESFLKADLALLGEVKEVASREATSLRQSPSL